MADDCGDNSDESLQLCEARRSISSEDETYFRDTFEEENESFFHNANNQETNWVRGSGDQLLKARSPAFDHTLFSDHGKVLFFLIFEFFWWVIFLFVKLACKIFQFHGEKITKMKSLIEKKLYSRQFS